MAEREHSEANIPAVHEMKCQSSLVGVTTVASVCLPLPSTFAFCQGQSNIIGPPMVLLSIPGEGEEAKRASMPILGSSAH